MNLLEENQKLREELSYRERKEKVWQGDVLWGLKAPAYRAAFAAIEDVYSIIHTVP